MEISNPSIPYVPPVAARRELWRRGSLVWKLTSTQKELYDLFYNSKFKIMTWLLARRSGKTHTLCVLALEQCIRNSNTIVKFVSPTKLQIETILKPIMVKILKDCPEELKPSYNKKLYTYEFTNGSCIQLAGTESGHAEKLRGGDSDLFIVDEAQSCSDLRNVVESILLPTTLTTSGRGILAGTPPEESEHDFLKYVEEADLRGSLIRKTVDDNKLITKEQLDELLREYPGGRNSPKARRELWCEIIKDSTTSVLPEFDEALEKLITKEWQRPPYYDCYEAMDTGGKDFTAILYAYYDFRADKVIIDDETVIDFRIPGQNTENLVKEIHDKEIQHWKNPLTLEYKKPYKRVSDIDYIFLNEIKHQSQKIHSPEQTITFETTEKDHRDAAIHDVRIMLNNQKIIINPRCKTLLRHLRNVKWNKSRTEFARSADDGHYDCVMALVYLIRNISFNKNPYPSNFQFNSNNFNPQGSYNPQKTSNQIQVLQSIFGIKPKRK